MISITRARDSVALCTDMSLKAEHTRAVAHMEQTRRDVQSDAREVDTRLRDAAEKVREIEARMRDHEVEFILEALTKKAWIEFVESHPPRKGDETDRTLGVDVSKLDKVIEASIVEVRSPDGDRIEFDRSQWTELADEMSNGQWEAFAHAVLRLNNGERGVPFSQAASSVMRRSEQTSKPQND